MVKILRVPILYANDSGLVKYNFPFFNKVASKFLGESGIYTLNKTIRTGRKESIIIHSL